MVDEGLATPRTQGGKRRDRQVRMYQLSARDVDCCDAAPATARAAIEYAAKRVHRPIVISVGTMCKRR